MDVFEECSAINGLLESGSAALARDRLICLLDAINKQKGQYDYLINHLIRETGLFPYMEPSTALWRERVVFESFKVDIGDVHRATLHSEQSLVLKHLLEGTSIAVSAPTSFGKSILVDAYIAIRKPINVVILVPTVALTDETRRRLSRKFSKYYKIITTSDISLGERNIFVFPQERALAYCDILEKIDLLVVDEFYKASKDFDKERSPVLLKAMLKLSDKALQRYYLAPNVSSLSENPFTKGMLFLRMDFNTVFLEKHDVYKKLNRDTAKKNAALLEIIGGQQRKSLIYAGTHAGVESVGSLLVQNAEVADTKLLADFSEWLAVNYHAEWKLTSLVLRRIGFHTGRLHRSLSQIQVRLFELKSEGLQTLVSTSSIIEGVNTSAENVIVWSDRKGQLKLDDFSYRNIIGRSGRMFRHFIGKVYLLEEPPLSTDIQLDISFPDQMLADVDEERFKNELTKDQIALLIYYREEMTRLMGSESFNRLTSSGQLQSSDTEVIKAIATAIIKNKKTWRALANLNRTPSNYWSWILLHVIKIVPAGWDSTYTKFAEFVVVLAGNWTHTIPEMLVELSDHDVTIDDFFKMERSAIFRLAALLHDVNVIQKEIVPEHQIDISNFIGRLSKAFLPTCVLDLEEYGLPRMIARKLHQTGFIDFEGDLDVHSAIELLRTSKANILARTEIWSRFDRFVLEYFFEGISVDAA